jgi:dienelactone hydrolase
MTEVLAFHHAQGLTPGIQGFAEDLRAAGHVVHLPDLFDGRTFDDVASGVAHAQSIGFETLVERGAAIAEDLPAELVVAGWSMGGMPAQNLAQTRPGTLGAILLETAIPLGWFGDTWPAGVPLQIHIMEDDPEGDTPVARELDAAVDDCELYVYPGDRHLFTDRSLAAHDETATALVLERVLAFLDRVA